MSKNYFRCHLAFCVGITGSLIFKFVDENAGLRAVEKTRLTYILTCITGWTSKKENNFEKETAKSRRK